MNLVPRLPTLSTTITASAEVRVYRSELDRLQKIYKNCLDKHLSSLPYPQALKAADEEMASYRKMFHSIQDQIIKVENLLLEASRCTAANPEVTEESMAVETLNLSPTRVSSEIKTLDPNLHKNFSCVLDTIVNSDDTTALPQTVHNLFTPPILIQENTSQGNAFFTSLQGANEKTAMFVAKTGKDSYQDRMVHEAVIGMYVTNRMRERVPNFMYVYSSFRCTSPVIEDEKSKKAQKITSWCDAVTGSSLYVMNENITDSVDLSTFIGGKNITTRDVAMVMLQVFNALALAHAYHRFVHYDLHAGNVLVKKLPTEQEVYFYDYSSGNVSGVVRTRYIPYIIDYGFAYASLEDSNRIRLSVGNAEMMPAIAYAGENLPLHDCYKVICFLAERAYILLTRGANDDRKRVRDIYFFLQRMFIYFAEDLTARISLRESNNRQYDRTNNKKFLDYYVIPPSFRSTPANPHGWQEYFLSIFDIYNDVVVPSSAFLPRSTRTLNSFVQGVSSPGESTVVRYCRALKSIGHKLPEGPERREAISKLNFDVFTSFYRRDRSTINKLFQKINDLLISDSENFEPRSKNQWQVDYSAIVKFRRILDRHLQIRDLFLQLATYIRSYQCILRYKPDEDISSHLYKIINEYNRSYQSWNYLAINQSVTPENLENFSKEYDNFAKNSPKKNLSSYFRPDQGLHKKDITQFWENFPKVRKILSSPL